MPIITVSSKGQLVIPSAIRKALNIEANSRMRVTVSKDKTRVVLEPLPKNPIESLTGLFKSYPHSLADELLKERKSDLGKEEA